MREDAKSRWNKSVEIVKMGLFPLQMILLKKRCHFSSFQGGNAKITPLLNYTIFTLVFGNMLNLHQKGVKITPKKMVYGKKPSF